MWLNSTFGIRKEILSILDQLFNFEKKKVDKCSFVGQATDTTDLDFYPEFKARVDFTLAYFLACMFFLGFTFGATPADLLINTLTQCVQDYS